MRCTRQADEGIPYCSTGHMGSQSSHLSSRSGMLVDESAVRNDMSGCNTFEFQLRITKTNQEH